MRVLLVEPAYRNKYPPLGLMKISAFHKNRDDEVTFAKGLYPELANQTWDRIYIATLFTFYWKETIDTIEYYKKCVIDSKNIFIGGVLATLLPQAVEKATGIKPVTGLLNRKNKVKIENDRTIDDMIPDYSIIDPNTNAYLKNSYPMSNAYFGYTTRGCIRKCDFCAVRILEPKCIKYRSIEKQIKETEKKFGAKKDLMLLDNNVLSSPCFDKIIDEIIEAGFYKGAKSGKAKRYVDFNQGLDARLLTREHMKRLAEIPLRPMRIAFDKLSLKDTYIKAVELAAEYGQPFLSNYILFNHEEDTPEDFYERLKINVELNARLGTQIFSFPMKFSPIFGDHNKDRKYIGKYWNKRYLRGIQCILNSTHGVVGPRKEFFEIAFGTNAKEFKQIISMPDNFILYRSKHRDNGAKEWGNIYKELDKKQIDIFIDSVSVSKRDLTLTDDTLIDKLLLYYM